MGINKYNVSATTGIGAPTILAIVFVVLKLTGVIDWSWWWVLSPVWIVWAICILILLIVVVWWLIERLRRKIKKC